MPKRAPQENPKTYAPVNKPLKWFKPNRENYRGHPEAQVERLRESIERFGIVKNIVARPDVTILRWQRMTGHAATLEATGQTFDELAATRR